VPDTRLAQINEIAATTGDDPELDTLLLRLHTETASTPLSAASLNVVYAGWETGLATDAAAGPGMVSARPVTSAQIGADQVNAFFMAPPR